MKRVLVVCRDNLVRSRYVQRYLRKRGIDADSCGVGVFAYIFGKKFKKRMVYDYDLIIVLDDKIFRKVYFDDNLDGRIFNLKIPNYYWFFIPFKIFWLRPIRHLKHVVPEKVEEIFC